MTSPHMQQNVCDQPPHAACYTNRPSLTGVPEAAFLLYTAAVGSRYKASTRQAAKAHKHTMNYHARPLAATYQKPTAAKL